MTSLDEIPAFKYRGPTAGFGEAYGSFCNDRIGPFYRDLLENIRLKTGLDGQGEEVSRLVGANWATVEEVAPEVSDVIRDIAQGAGRPVAEIRLLNSFMDLISLRSNTVATSVLGCTTMSGMLPGNPVVAQNYDMERFYGRHIVALDVSLTDGPGFKAFSFVGVPGCAGVSRAGWAVGINYLHCADIAPGGMPHIATVFRALSAGTIGEAIGSVLHGRRACGHHYLFSDKSGVSISLEVSASQMAQQDVTGQWFVHTNHYLADRMAHLDELLYTPNTASAPARRGSSLVRRARARQLIAQNPPGDGDDLLAILSDTCNAPMGICTADTPGEDIWGAGTIASLVAFPASGKLRIEQRSPVARSLTI